MRNKGKVHPCTSSSYTPYEQSLSVLKLLPAAIFALISALSAADREVLAYMITRSLKSTNPSFLSPEYPENPPKKQSSNPHGHKSFDCDCFDCYTSFWCRWDSSPNRELIHHAIEAFEEHLNSGEQVKKSGSSRNRRKEKIGRRKGVEMGADGGGIQEISSVRPPEIQDNVPPENEVEAREGKVEGESRAPPSAVGHGRRGLARKVLPDVMGIFSSRLWSLWGPEL